LGRGKNRRERGEGRWRKQTSTGVCAMMVDEVFRSIEEAITGWLTGLKQTVGFFRMSVVQSMRELPSCDSPPTFLADSTNLIHGLLKYFPWKGWILCVDWCSAEYCIQGTLFPRDKNICVLSIYRGFEECFRLPWAMLMCTLSYGNQALMMQGSLNCYAGCLSIEQVQPAYWLQYSSSIFLSFLFPWHIKVNSWPELVGSSLLQIFGMLGDIRSI
jgi:hypothetical protein